MDDPDSPIYLDHAATTPLDPVVLEAMRPHLEHAFGNPSGAYGLGRRARGALETARDSVAEVLGCRSPEVVFTSGGSESDNLALRGVAAAMRAQGRGNHLVTTAVEHKAVLATAEDLVERHGFELTVVGVDGVGLVHPEEVLDAVRSDTVLVSVMLANNEVGSIQPVAELSQPLRERGVLLHTDAVQAGAWLDLDVDRLGVDLMSLSGHKLYGPKGVGVLYVRQGTPLSAVQTGGGQEGGRRAGTENVAAAVGLAEALRRAAQMRGEVGLRVAVLRDRLLDGLTALPEVTRTGPSESSRRLPGHATICARGVRADSLLLGLDMRGICASSGSACSSGSLDPSHVLHAMGIPAADAVGAVRFSLGRGTTAAEVVRVLEVAPGLIERLREAVPA
jgi:cysteine desulfurase